MEIHVPGDFADLHGFTLKQLDHDLRSITECVIGYVPHERLMELTEKHAHLTRVYWLSTNIDAAISREMGLSLGQRSAISRMAHLFCELHARLDVITRTDGETFEFPLTQRELAECLGLTVVHVNRTIQELRRKGLVEAANRHIRILTGRGSKPSQISIRDICSFTAASFDRNQASGTLTAQTALGGDAKPHTPGDARP
jgi:CRP-like cAMP-binding protein